MADEFDQRVCDKTHESVDRRLSDLKDENDRLDGRYEKLGAIINGKFNKIIGMIIITLLTIISSLIITMVTRH